ncbi:MAG: ShlB/FhaC/HecB family hemolysin secretion/activation protein, partial [Leptolyngbyaceae cyanobacterium bins.59]|nr:ShlB/FhaC/HecB family hemolysin secretion/activation protein [Leptolyngbyaceae cyanobacterium bins.59]
RNLISANGDQLAASFSRSTTGGSSLFDFSYRVVLNPMNGTVQLRYAPSEYKITDPAFSAFGIRGNSELFELSFRQPVIRTPRQELAFSVGFARQTGRTFLFDNFATPFGIGPESNGTSRTSVFKFGQDYITRDVQGAWAFRSQFNFGVDFLGVTNNPSPIPDGQFFSWLGQAQRVQVLNNDQVLIVQADLQLTPDTLLPSQQFVIGGGQSLRGYRQNARSGDNGFRFSAENRIVVQRNEAGAAEIQLAPFIDLGVVWNTSGNPNALRNETFLVGAGAGVIWQPFPGFGLRLDYAVPFISTTDRGNNVQDSAFYFSVNYQL